MSKAPNSLTAPQLVRRYMKVAGWHQARFARICGLDRSLVSLLLSGRRAFTAHTALLIEQATKAAKAAGSTTAEPLTVSQLLPELFPAAVDAATARTGTEA